MSAKTATAGLEAAAKSLSELYRSAGKATSQTEEQQIAVSKQFMKWLAVPLITQMGLTEKTTGPVTTVDLAGGNGVVMQELQAILPNDVLQKSSFLTSDNSEAIVELAKKRIAVEGWVNTEAKVVDAMSTGLPDSNFTHASVAMAFHLIPRPDDALQECKRILKPGGIFGLTTPHNDVNHSMWQPDIRSAFASFPFDAPFPENFPTQMHDHGHWADADWVGAHLKEQGFKDVESRIVRGTLHVASVDDFMMAMGGMLVWLVNGWWSKETREAHPLEEVRELTRKHLEEKHGGKAWDLRWAIVCATGRLEE